MSTFAGNWEQCMHANGLPVPSVEDAEEALEFLHKLHSAWENAGGGEQLTVGALLVAGAFVGIDEGALVVLGEVAQIAAALYISACIGCIASVALDEMKKLFASNELPGFVVAELDSRGVDLTADVVA